MPRHGGAPDRHAEHHLVEDGLNPRTERRRPRAQRPARGAAARL